jgi:hypothetical protein
MLSLTISQDKLGKTSVAKASDRQAESLAMRE